MGHFHTSNSEDFMDYAREMLMAQVPSGGPTAIFHVVLRQS